MTLQISPTRRTLCPNVPSGTPPSLNIYCGRMLIACNCGCVGGVVKGKEKERLTKLPWRDDCHNSSSSTITPSSSLGICNLYWFRESFSWFLFTESPPHFQSEQFKYWRGTKGKRKEERNIESYYLKRQPIKPGGHVPVTTTGNIIYWRRKENRKHAKIFTRELVLCGTEGERLKG